MLPDRFGIPVSVLSDLQAWEGPDPAYWCNHGYAIVNPDARGAFMSEGDIHFWGSQEAEDGHDLIEWLAVQDWSNGNVGLSGNSWLAILQWFIAATQPPHLAAIAPWEGLTDLYRHDIARGGIPNTVFNNNIITHLFGNHRTEDIPAMLTKYPLMNAYWKEKAAKLEKIGVPAYVVASYTNALHAYGTFEGYHGISSREKWLRVHNTMEWVDYYDPVHMEDLRRFFDCYLKDIENGWKQTPKVRLSVLDPGGVDEVGRVESDFPPPQSQDQKLFLDGKTGTLTVNPLAQESQIRYRADDGKGQATFTIKFEEETELIGHLKLRLWVEADGADDMDLFIFVQKLDKNGDHLTTTVIPMPENVKEAPLGLLLYPGPNGRLRVSQRQLDEEHSTPSRPYHTYQVEELLSPGQIVPVEIPIYPVGMRWHGGEQLRVIVAGYDLKGPVFPGMPLAPTRNRGEHIIHTGGAYDSHLLVPMMSR
jgi:predicted acyl esterase